MKSNFIILVISSLMLQSCIFFTGNNNDNFEPVFSNYNQVKMNRTDFENAVKLVPTKNISKSGKIYIKENIMLVNDVNKGFQIYNYSDAQNPVKIAYIEIPGATDVAIRNNTIYVNQAVDLVALNFNTTTNTISVLSRNKNIFPQKRSPDGFYGDYNENEVITDWILK